MRNYRRKIDLNIQTSFLLFVAITLLLLPLRILIAWILAVFVHELSHYIALKIYRIEIHSISFAAVGAKIETAPITRKEELICSVAGPIGGLLPIFFFRHIPITAIFSVALSVINLVPIGDRDGARFLRCLIDDK